MAYRTRVNGIQIFGNNDYFEEWAEFIRSQGTEISEEGLYEGEITDVQGMFDVIDKITKKLIAEKHEQVLKGDKDWDDTPIKELADLSDSMWLDEHTPVLAFNKQMIENAYCFLPYQVYIAVKDKLEPAERYEKDGVDWTFCSYKLKEGERITVSAS